MSRSAGLREITQSSDTLYDTRQQYITSAPSISNQSSQNLEISLYLVYQDDPRQECFSE